MPRSPSPQPVYALPCLGQQLQLIDTILREKIGAQTRLLDPDDAARQGEIALFLREGRFVRLERKGCSHPVDKYLCNDVSINDLRRHGVIAVPDWSRNASGFVVVRSFCDESLGTVAHGLEDALNGMHRFWISKLRRDQAENAAGERKARRLEATTPSRERRARRLEATTPVLATG